MNAVFMDKDGTLVRDFPYNIHPEKILWESFVLEGLRALQKHYTLFVVSNQSGIAHGYFDEGLLSAYWKKFDELLKSEGIRIAGYYYCPHHPEGKQPTYSRACNCRKPAPGLIMQAAREHDLILSQSWMIGDILHDIEAGHRAGCKSILVNNGNETEWVEGRYRTPDFIAADFGQAANFILKTQLHYEALGNY